MQKQFLYLVGGQLIVLAALWIASALLRWPYGLALTSAGMGLLMLSGLIFAGGGRRRYDQRYQIVRSLSTMTPAAHFRQEQADFSENLTATLQIGVLGLITFLIGAAVQGWL